MLNLSRFAKSFVKATKGTFNGAPRMLNVDQNIYITGYAEINDQATSPFSRIKVHKGLFTCNKTDVLHGDLVQDLADGNKYIVMSIKDKFCGEASVYFDCALYFCNTAATVSRYPAVGARDAFNRLIDSEPAVVYTDVPIMIDTKNLLTTASPDSYVETDKINIYVQSKYLLEDTDRITTTEGDVYRIETIDKAALTNIWVCKVNKDNR